MPRIFINYRRSDSQGFAHAIYNLLESHFGKERVFMDVDAIRPGEDYEKELSGAVAKCDIALVLIGPRWLEVEDQDGIRRLDKVGDWVRIEIISALESDIPVIPVLVGGAKMPSSDALPDAIKPLSKRQAFRITDRFKPDMERLIKEIKLIHKESEAEQKAEKARQERIAKEKADAERKAQKKAKEKREARERDKQTRISKEKIEAKEIRQTGIKKRSIRIPRKALISLGVVVLILISGFGIYWFGQGWFDANDQISEDNNDIGLSTADIDDPSPTETSTPQLTGENVLFWHTYIQGSPKYDYLRSVTEDFNATNEYGITVKLVYKESLYNLVNEVKAGLPTNHIPNIAEGNTRMFLYYGLESNIVDLVQFVLDSDYGLTLEELDAIYPGVYDNNLTKDGRLLAWPFYQSAIGMVYNYSWAIEMGYDIPVTSSELKAQVCDAAEMNANDNNQDNDGTGGLVWHTYTTYFLSLVYAFGGQVLNISGDAYDFSAQPWIDAAYFINDLNANGCAFETTTVPAPEQANRLALVTLSYASYLPNYSNEFEKANNNDDWLFLPLRGPDGRQATNKIIYSLIVLQSTPEKDLASWLFVRFLTSPENQAKWIEASGHLPTQTSTLPFIQEYIASNPIYESALALAPLERGSPVTFPGWFEVEELIAAASAEIYHTQTREQIINILNTLTSDANQIRENYEN